MCVCVCVCAHAEAGIKTNSVWPDSRRCGQGPERVKGVGQGDMEREVSKGQDWKVVLVRPPKAMGQEGRI